MIDQSSCKFIVKKEKLKLFAKFHHMISSSHLCRRRSLLHFFDEIRSWGCVEPEMLCDVCRFEPELVDYDITNVTLSTLEFLKSHCETDVVLSNLLQGKYQCYPEIPLYLGGIMRNCSEAFVRDYIFFLISNSILTMTYSLVDQVPSMFLEIGPKGFDLLNRIEIFPLMMQTSNDVRFPIIPISTESPSKWRSHCQRLHCPFKCWFCF